MGKSIVGGVTIINTLTQKNDGEFPIAMARDIFMNDNTTVEDRINALKNYTHPVTPGYRHIPSGGGMGQYLKWKDDGEAQWATIPNATNNVDGFLSHLDKAKLDNIAENANNYVHPETSGYKHIPTGGEAGNILKWKADGEAEWGTEKTYQNASTTSAGLMSAEDKQKLDTISSGAGNYVHPTTPGNKHIPAGGSSNQILRWKSDGEAQWDNETAYNEVTTTNSGLMSANDKKKLDGIASGANAYTHPSGSGYKHIPAGGEEGQYLKYTDDGEAQWATLDIPEYDVVSDTKNGLMTKEDKAKLDNIDNGANNYVHPEGSGYKHIPAGGSVGQVLKYVSDGTAMWANDTDTVYTHPTYTKENLGLYKLSVDELGHVNSVSPVVKADITALGISGGEGPTYTTGTESTPGITKLYSKTGDATDGAMTQKAVTDELSKKANSTHTHEVASNSSSGFMSAADKAKLDSVAEGATKYTHPTTTAYASGLYKITTNNLGHVINASEVVKSDITALGIPETNTTYSEATSTDAGLMSAADKAKLLNIASNANNYSHPTFTAHNSGLYKITVNNNGHVSAATVVTKADITGLGISGESYTEATTSKSGLLSNTDKAKLDSISEGANKYIHPSYTNRTNGLYKITVDNTGHVSGVSNVTKDDIVKLGIPSEDTNTTYSEASTSESGLMSAEDKKKLDDIPVGGGTYKHPTYTKESLGLYKLSVDELGHVNSVSPVQKADITALGISGGEGATYTTGTETTPGVTKLYSKTGDATDGAMTQKAVTDELASKSDIYHKHPDASETNSGFLNPVGYKVLERLNYFKIARTDYTSDQVNVVASALDENMSEIEANYIVFDGATSATSGIMTAADKAKLDSIDEGAKKYTVATDSSDGLMSAADKAKLDKISLPTSIQIGFGATAPEGLNVGDLWIQTNE